MSLPRACQNHFNPHSPRGERPGYAEAVGVTEIFQSTLPARGATSSRPVHVAEEIFQSTLPARGATLSGRPDLIPSQISIHTPREGSDRKHGDIGPRQNRFQSTLPARGATWLFTNKYYSVQYFNPHSPRGERPELHDEITTSVEISIHTPREGSDLDMPYTGMYNNDFNPHSPRGERQLCACMRVKTKKFQSTLPARGATDVVFIKSQPEVISIHTPREGSDFWQQVSAMMLIYFNPHSPRGERRRRRKIRRG